MRWIVLIILLLVLFPFGVAIANTAQEYFNKKFNRLIYMIIILFVEAITICMLTILPKCNGKETIAPNGQTELEHYEPRF